MSKYVVRFASRASRDLLKVREDVFEASASDVVANEYLCGLVPAGPLEYFDRWSRHNELFGNITRISGVAELAGHGLVVVTEQDALYDEFPAADAVEGFMRSAGFVAESQLAFAWYNRERNLAVFDARPGNFILVEDTAVPFDVIPVPFDQVLDWP